jgi:hypothetical protein
MNDAAVPDSLLRPPEVIRRYQSSHDRRDVDGALSAFTADAKVVDEDREYRGVEEIRHWLETAASAFTYVRTLLSAETPAPGKWLVVNHLAGDFPGGVVDLRYQYRLTGDLISELLITP